MFDSCRPDHNVDDDGKLRRRFINKRVNAAKEQIKFDLTFAQYVKLVKRAGLRSSQLGFTGENYVLARYGDSGPYRIGNCRFITQAENMRERKPARVTQKRLDSNRRALKNARKALALSQWLFGSSEGSIKGAATRKAQVQAELEKMDAQLLRLKVRREIVNYPEWGWKTRLAPELGITKRVLYRFLDRNPSYVDSL